MHDWVPVLGPVALLLLAGAGYLIRRRLEGRTESEVAKTVLDWIEVHKAIYGSAPSVDEIRTTRAAFLRRSAHLDSTSSEAAELASIKEQDELVAGMEVVNLLIEKLYTGPGRTKSTITQAKKILRRESAAS